MKRLFALALLGMFLAGCAAPRSSAPPPRPASTIPPGPPRGEPEAYVGLAPAALRAAFGPPAFVRKDGSTEMWRYDGATCRAFFFLYGPRGGEQVRHVETLPHAPGSAADIACLTALRLTPAKTS